MLNRPPICSTVSITDPFKPFMFDDIEQSEEKKNEKKRAIGNQVSKVSQYDRNLEGLEKRAKLAEIILGLVIVVIINCACFTYCKMYSKKETDDSMRQAVNQ